MDIKKLQTLVVNALEDVKAQNIKVYDTTKLSSLFDRLCIASGTSNRQTKALASSVREKVKEHGGEIVGIEGEDIGEWVLVDLGDMVVHIMQPAIREYYRLEELWGDNEVKVELTTAKRATKTASTETSPSPTKRVRKPVKKTSSDAAEKPKRTTRTSKAASDTTPKKKPAPRKKATASDTTSARPAAAKRSTTKRKAV